MRNSVRLQELRDFAAKKAISNPAELVDINKPNTGLTAQWARSVLPAGSIIESSFEEVEVWDKDTENLSSFSAHKIKIPNAFEQWNRAHAPAESEFTWQELVDALDWMLEGYKDV